MILLVHGGAGPWSPALRGAASIGVRGALHAGWERLAAGGSALDAVEAAVAAMEDDQTFNAGLGSCLTRDGRVQMDALIMNGAGLEAGAVACVERLRNPIRAARAILEHSPHVLFAGADAERLAESLGLELCENEQLRTQRRAQDLAQSAHSSPHDTVGAVALDAAGNLAAATSTGGMTGKEPGRVGDSPLVGCGAYADNAVGAASTTGWGEPIMKLVLAKWAVDRLGERLGPQPAAELAIERLAQRLDGMGGIILLDPGGRHGTAWNTAAMPWGLKSDNRELVQELQSELA
jgi:L-asparaginase / beta-aspartyl-peptidase